MSDEVESLRGELLALKTIARRNEEEMEGLLRESLRLEDRNTRVHRQWLQVSQQLVDSESRVRELEQSTSFRLGYAIASSLKSPSRLLALFPLLWKLAVHRSLPQPGEPGPVSDYCPLPVVQESPETETPSQENSRAPRRSPMLRTAPRNLAGLRVAAIMDEFTRSCFLPTCKMQTLHAARYEEQLIDIDPHLLLVESAWNGDDGSWRNKVSNRSGELLGLLDLCHRRNIPTVFWNKEDPSHFDTFLETARLFEHVFTTDIDSIRRYSLALGHERIHLLPFACQPRIHNPVVAQERQLAFSFAGSYYHRYPERCEDLDRLVTTLSTLAPVVIYDRNSERGDPAFKFPRKYAGMLRPALPYSRINEAYKGYRFAINLTTIKQSQSMFARRVYELLASNTVTISNYSRGVRQLFGDLVIASDVPEAIERRLRPLLESPGLARRLRAQALRKVMRQHTYEMRMQYIAERVMGITPALVEHSVNVVAKVRSQEEFDVVVSTFASQSYVRRRLFLVAARGFVPERVSNDDRFHMMREQDAAGMLLADYFRDEWVAALNPADYYGPDYLQDLMLATKYSDDPFIGKGACYEWLCEGVEAAAIEQRYRRDTVLLPRACVARASHVYDKTLLDWVEDAARADSACEVRGLSIDEFNYCRSGAGCPSLDVDGTIEDLDTGLDLDDLIGVAEVLPVTKSAPATGAADFLAVATRSGRLQVVADPSCFAEMHAPDSSDLFVYCSAPTKSFVETSTQDVMQGTAEELGCVLSTGRYLVAWVRAPDAGVCSVLREYAATCDFRVRLTNADLARATSDSPWLVLLREAYPRVHTLLDDVGSIRVLEDLLGTPAGSRHHLVTESA